MARGREDRDVAVSLQRRATMTTSHLFLRLRLSAALAALLLAVSACSAVHPVSSFNTNGVEGAAGSANDLTTGGQGTSSHGDIDE